MWKAEGENRKSQILHGSRLNLRRVASTRRRSSRHPGVAKREKTNDELAVEAVIGEPVSTPYSLFRGKIQGNFGA